MPADDRGGGGRLYVVSTPIGNLEDVTLRALRILKECDLIAAEDTRHTRILLAHHGIDRPLVSYHEWNERGRAEELAKAIEEGKKVAVVTDAGTPAVSDPGYRIIRAVIDRGLPVEPIPGPSAVLAALVASGFPVDRWIFEGYLPPRSAPRRRFLSSLKDETRTVIVFETPHRILEALHDMAGILGDRPVALCREMTKFHEEILRGTPSELLAALGTRPPKGEITLLIARTADRDKPSDQGLVGTDANPAR